MSLSMRSLLLKANSQVLLIGHQCSRYSISKHLKENEFHYHKKRIMRQTRMFCSSGTWRESSNVGEMDDFRVQEMDKKFYCRQEMQQDIQSCDLRAEKTLKENRISKYGHVPVMVKEVLSYLQPKNNEVILDMTFGGGGHAREILGHSPNTCYIAADRDPLAFDLATQFASHYKPDQVIPLLSKFSELPSHFNQLNIPPNSLDCVLMDLGVSSMQFDSRERGFGLSQNGPLDMRMDGHRFPDSPTVADVVNSLEVHDLAKILKTYGEEKMAKHIAHAIVEARYAFGKFTHTKQLADVVKAVFESKFRHDKLHRHSHVATKTFQALRIFVNDELNEIHKGLNVAHKYLKPGGRCVTISFHSLEDRIVKRHFHGIDMDLSSNISLHGHLRNSRVSYDNQKIRDRFLSSWQWIPSKRKVLEASMEEVEMNPRARSAKLRAATKAV